MICDKPQLERPGAASKNIFALFAFEKPQTFAVLKHLVLTHSAIIPSTTFYNEVLSDRDWWFSL